MKATTYAVSGASGGLGTSTLALSMATYLSAQSDLGGAVVLVDGDPAAGGAAIMAGVEHLPGLRWSDLADVSGAADGARVIESLPRRGGLAILSGDDLGRAPAPDVQREVMSALRGACTALVVDAGRSGAVEARPWGNPTWHVLLTGVGVRHLHDVQRVSAQLGEAPVQVLSRGPRSRAALGARIAAHVGRDWAGHWRDDARVAAALERGALGKPRLPRQLIALITQPDAGQSSVAGPSSSETVTAIRSVA